MGTSATAANAKVIDALPYIDDDYGNPLIKAEVDRLVEEEMCHSFKRPTDFLKDLSPLLKFDFEQTTTYELNALSKEWRPLCVKNMEIKKHIKGGPDHEGGIFTVEAPLHASYVQVVDPITGRPCKVGVKYLEDGTKVRVARGTCTYGSIILRPDILKIRATPRLTTTT